MENKSLQIDLDGVKKINNITLAFSETFPAEILHFHAITSAEAGYMQTQKEHKHHFFELHFVLNGDIRYSINGELIDVKSPSYILIMPQLTHKIEYFSSDFVKCSVAFSVEKDEELYGYLCMKSGQTPILTQEQISALKFCITEAAKDNCYSSVMIKNRIHEIIYTIADITERKRRYVPIDKGDMRLVKAKQFIDDNPHMFFSCDDIASYCYMSVKQLNRIFIKYEGATLLQYIHNQKIASAERLLKNPSMSLQEISEALGFSSVYYFSRFFSKHTGFPPGNFRRNFT